MKRKYIIPLTIVLVLVIADFKINHVDLTQLNNFI